MNKISTKWLLLAAVLLVFSVSTAYAGGAVVITEPGTGSTVSNPVKVCMAVDVEVQPAKRELILVRVTTTFLLTLTFLKI